MNNKSNLNLFSERLEALMSGSSESPVSSWSEFFGKSECAAVGAKVAEVPEEQPADPIDDGAVEEDKDVEELEGDTNIGGELTTEVGDPVEFPESGLVETDGAEEKVVEELEDAGSIGGEVIN